MRRLGLVLACLSAVALAEELPVPKAPATPQPSPSDSGKGLLRDRKEVAAAERQVAVLAGGCFWGMQDILRKIPGVVATEVGYTGGWQLNPRYEDTHDSRSGHAEAVRVVFDPRALSYEDLLEKWFFRMHDPTTLNRQGNDVGTQYRSAIFYVDETQKAVAEAVKARVDRSGKWKRPVVTEIARASAWYPAEAYHQDYLVKNPGGYTCHYLRPW